ncbi:MAG TPA: methyltransferase [Burkholderiaceae bacterium]|nr:methyltransferase [Burkholderiaceae bacterium]
MIAGTLAGALEFLRARRDRLLSSPAFQRASTAFLLTRPVARASSRELFDLVAGFVYSQVLLATIRLRLLDRVAEGPRTGAELAIATGMPRERLQHLLQAAVALRLLQQRGPRSEADAPRYGLGFLGAALRGNPGVAAMVDHHALLYGDLADPIALLRDRDRRTALARFWAYAQAPEPGELDDESVAPYTRLMSSSQQFICDEVLAAYPFGRHRHLLDIGGGDGTFAAEAARRHPRLSVTLVDLPPVARAARARFEQAGIGSRAVAIGSDFRVDPLPTGADLVTLVRVVHDHDDDIVARVLRSARTAIRDDGVLLVAEPMAAQAGAKALSDAYFSMYLLAMGSGKPRDPDALRALLRDAGFREIRVHATRNPLLLGLISARPAT